jgi:DNA/RNA-binding protein KIN17
MVLPSKYFESLTTGFLLTSAQVCERQMRDENGFKMHTSSEGHVRKMLVVGENAKKFISDYSSQFQRDFLLLLRTSHGEKKVQLNHFYQEYISNKEHVHMNATKWPSLTEFAKFLGREGICRVEENEKGIHVAWIDNSPEALRRQDAIRKKERQDKGDEEREQMLIREQIQRAQADAEKRGDGEFDEDENELKREEGEKIKLSFAAKLPESKQPLQSPSETAKEEEKNNTEGEQTESSEVPAEAAPAPARISMKMGFSSKPKNVFAVAKKNALGGKKVAVVEQPKKMSEAERIMREEMERKGKRGPPGFGGPPAKKPRF